MSDVEYQTDAPNMTQLIVLVNIIYCLLYLQTVLVRKVFINQ